MLYLTVLLHLVGLRSFQERDTGHQILNPTRSTGELFSIPIKTAAVAAAAAQAGSPASAFGLGA
jgi:hypothetical protein